MQPPPEARRKGSPGKTPKCSGRVFAIEQDWKGSKLGPVRMSVHELIPILLIALVFLCLAVGSFFVCLVARWLRARNQILIRAGDPAFGASDDPESMFFFERPSRWLAI